MVTQKYITLVNSNIYNFSALVHPNTQYSPPQMLAFYPHWWLLVVLVVLLLLVLLVAVLFISHNESIQNR